MLRALFLPRTLNTQNAGFELKNKRCQRLKKLAEDTGLKNANAFKPCTANAPRMLCIYLVLQSWKALQILKQLFLLTVLFCREN